MSVYHDKPVVGLEPGPGHNLLLEALPQEALARLLPHLKLVDLPR
jgi:hypothetical protein